MSAAADESNSVVLPWSEYCNGSTDNQLEISM